MRTAGIDPADLHETVARDGQIFGQGRVEFMFDEGKQVASHEATPEEKANP